MMLQMLQMLQRKYSRARENFFCVAERGRLGAILTPRQQRKQQQDHISSTYISAENLYHILYS